MNRSTPNPAASRAKIALALAAAIIAFGRILAYDQYSQNGGDATYCGACHGDFRASPYTSLVDGQSWGNDLHDVHRNTMLGGDCNTCHSGSSRFPVRLAVSSGGSGLAAISCMGCHGRSQDGAQSYGAGLRQHHFRAGQTVCANCHTDCNPANKTVVGENVLPPYYASPGTGHSIPTNPCNPSPTYTENYAGSTLGLDNDGDDLFDQADPDCGPSAVCGNGRVETGEQCDDGNTVSGDCCSSTCQFESVGSPCNDGLFCTVGETCNGSGACGGGTPRDCSDAFSCTTDSCSEATDACVHAPDNAACNDGVFCNGVETCSASSGCQPGTPVDCTDNDICTDDSCNEATKACDHVFDPTNDPSCVVVCGNGRLETGEQCDDGNTVSGDCCSSTCQFDAAGSPCNDGLFCTVGETCNGSGACGGGTPRDCSDAFSCTTDSCSEATDACVHTPDDAACSDGVFCNGVETCSATLGCQAGTPVDCNDNDICTDDACNESAQRCDHVFDATNAPGCGGTVTWPAWRGPLADSRYAGSQACAGCHPAQYQSWAGSLHARMLIPPGNAQAAGFVLPDNNSVPGTTISITSWSDVLFVVGEKWKTLYVDRTGQIQRAQWNYATGQWNSHPGGPYDCGACHTTGYNPAPTFTDPAGQPVPGIAGTWVEYNIGCEACHGPGAEHAAAPTNSNINRIVLDWTATGEGTRTPSIRSAEVCGNCHYRSDHSGTLDPQRRSESQFNDWLAGRHSSTLETTTLSTYCAKCHSPGNATADSEEHYFSYFDPKEATHVACVSCHDPHGASNGRWATLRWPNGGRQDPKDYPAAIARYRGTDNNPATSDYTPVDPSLSTPLCTDCHKTQPGFRRHVDASPPTTVTLHPPANFGQPFVVPHMEHIEEGNAQCVSCHMPYSRTSINPDDVRTHSFVPNEVEIGGSVHYSVTCGQCHDEAQDCVWCHGEFARRTVNTPAGNAPGRRPGKREHASPVAP